MTRSTDRIADTDPPSAYDAWRNEIDRICQETFLLGLDDMPDMQARAAFDAGTTARRFFDETVVPTLREVHGSFVDAVLADGSSDHDLDLGATPDVD